MKMSRWLGLGLFCVFGCGLDPDPAGIEDDGTAGDDGDGDMGDGSGGDDGPVVDGSTVTIYDIQQGKVGEGLTVRVENVIVTTAVRGEMRTTILVQEEAGGPYSGLFLYLYDEVVDSVSLAPGDKVTLVGQYGEYYGSSQLTVKNPGDLEVVGQGPIPEPVVVTPADVAKTGERSEPYESVLVRLENVEVTNPDLGHANWEVAGAVIVTNSLLFDTDGPIYPPEGTVLDHVQGPLIFNFDEFKIAPRGADDVGGAGGQPTGPITIYDIQGGKVNPGAQVTLEQVVVTTPVAFKGDTFFVQERDGGAYSGISVYVGDRQGLQVQPGMLLDLEGVYEEYYDQSQIRVASVAGITMMGTADVPAAEVLASSVVGGGQAAEQWEGVLVTVQDAVVSQAANRYGEWEVDQALVLDDFFFAMADWMTPDVGTTFTAITGVMTYSFERYKLAPRTAADFEPAG